MTNSADNSMINSLIESLMKLRKQNIAIIKSVTNTKITNFHYSETNPFSTLQDQLLEVNNRSINRVAMLPRKDKFQNKTRDCSILQ